MKFFHHLKQQTKARGRASAESSLDTSAAAPDSGFTFVKNSQGASAAVAELSRCLDTAIDQIELDGDLTDQVKFELGRLNGAAAGFANSKLGGNGVQSVWDCSPQDAQLISLAWKCAAATHEEGVVAPTDGISVEVLKYIKPSMGGSVKAALVALIEHSSVPPLENLQLPVLVIAIRGSKSTVDFMVNANGKSEDIESLLQVNELLPPTETSRTIRAHAGFLSCATALVKYIDTLIMNSKAEHILFTGHSAGGAVASLLFLKYLAEAKKKASNRKLSFITFGAPPVIQPNLNHILHNNRRRTTPNLGLTLAIVNEYDLVSRIDQPYIRSLVDLYRSLFQLGPVPDDDDDNGESTTTSETASASLPTTSTLDSGLGARVWELPKPEFWLLGEIVLWRTEAVDVKRENGQGATRVVAREKILRAFVVQLDEFARLVFCRVQVHRRQEYEMRVKMLMGEDIK